jgi:anthranilate phosphoribosyltransferase
MVCELRGGRLRRYTLSPDDFGLSPAAREQLEGGSSEENARLLCDVLAGKPGPHFDVVVANAAAALYVADVADSVRKGADIARGVLESGRALTRLEQLIQFSRSTAGVVA